MTLTASQGHQQWCY